MKSGIRVFSRCGYKSAKGLLLPRSEFKFYSDLENINFDPVKADYIVKTAEKYLEEEIKVIPLSLFRDKYLTGSRSNYENVHHHRRSMLFFLLMAEVHERKGRFVEKIADLVWAIMEESSWVIPAHQANSLMRPGSDVPEIFEEKDVPGLDLYAANCAATLGMVRYFLKDELDAISPVICERIDHLVYLRAVRPYIVGTYWWMGAAHNWPTGITMNILTATAATVEDMEIREAIVTKAFSILDNFTSGMPEDGCCDEGPGYWGAGAGGVFIALLILNDMSGGKINVFGDPMIRNLCEYISKVNIHDDYFVNFADCHGRMRPNGNMICEMGKWLDSPELLSFGRAMEIERSEKYYFFGYAYQNFRDAAAPLILTADAVKAHKAVWMSGHQVAVFRESDDTSKGLFLATKGGTNSEPGNHNDVGCLIIFSDGKPIAVDPGIGSYNNDYFTDQYRYMRWFTNSNAHSCPEINGFQQRQRNGSTSKNEVCDIDVPTVSMEISSAYPPEAGLEELTRTCSLKDGKIEVNDFVKLTEEGSYAFHLNLINEPRIIEDGRIDIGEGRVIEYDAHMFVPTISRVENKCLPYDDLNINHHWGVDCLWDLALGAKVKEQNCRFIVK